MPGVIDPQAIHTDELPTVWSSIQSELSPEEHAKELEDQATASLLWASPAPEQILRLLLNETSVGQWSQVEAWALAVASSLPN